MRNRDRYQLVAIAIISWVVFGAGAITAGASLLLGYSQTQNAIAFGGFLGGAVGLAVGSIAVSPAVSQNRTSVFYWGLLGSMVGAILGVLVILWVGGFPRRTQADLSLIFLGPGSLTVGAIAGVLVAAALGRWFVWRGRSR